MLKHHLYQLKPDLCREIHCAPLIFIIVVDYVLRMSVDKISNKGFEIKPRRSSRHPAEHLIETDLADDIAMISESFANP